MACYPRVGRDSQEEEGKTNSNFLRSFYSLSATSLWLQIVSGCRTSLVADRGGGSRGRTGDIQLAKLALYQLSYAPEIN